MRVPLSWLREYARLPEPLDAAEAGRRLTAAGLEVESVEPVGHDIRDVVVGQVLAIEELTGFKKPIRYCRVATSEAGLAGDPAAARGVVCGASNFAVGDRVPVALPGAVLPGGFEITARTTYGHVSDGMICSAKELDIGDDHTGILVLEPDAPLGADFVAYAGLRDEVLQIAVTPDRGYAVSIRGMARELASAYGAEFRDPVAGGWGSSPGCPPSDAQEAYSERTLEPVVGGPLDSIGADVQAASIADPTACDRFVLREVRGFAPGARTPLWMRVRLARCGVRCVSLAVDVTNYLMLELGQPLHAFDASKLTGPIVVRRARAGETLETLDHVRRALDPEDILITDSSGPISMAGTMGGLSTEIDEATTDLVIEGAHFSDVGTAKMSRRHKLHSEASYRFERGVDRELPLVATAKAAALLASLGGGRVVPGCTHAQVPVGQATIAMAADYPDRVAGVAYGRDTVVRRLTEVGCQVRTVDAGPPPTIAPWRAVPPAERARGPVVPGSGPFPGVVPAPPAHHGGHDLAAAVLEVTPPSWRPDLTDPADLAEEVIRLEGYAGVPVRMPRALAGHGLTPRQKLLRAIARTLGGTGFVEVVTEPFAAVKDADSLGLAPEDDRRPAVRVANPLSEDEPYLRTTLLPGLLRALAKNAGRGFGDVALFETGLVFRPRPGAPATAPILATDRGPTGAELASLEAALPDQPMRIGAVLAGNRELPGWWGPGRAATWADAIEAARSAGRVCHLTLEVRAAQEPPWHPGRCAALYVRAAADGSGGPLAAGRQAAPVSGAPAPGGAGGTGSPPRRGVTGGSSPGGKQSVGPRGLAEHEWLAGHAGELHPRVIAAFGLPPRTCALELDFPVLALAAEAAGPVTGPKLSAYPLATQDVALVVPASVPAASVTDALAHGAGELLEDIRLFDVYTGSQLADDEKSLAYTLRFRAPDRTLTVAETTAARDAAVAEAARRAGAVLRS